MHAPPCHHVLQDPRPLLVQSSIVGVHERLESFDVFLMTFGAEQASAGPHDLRTQHGARRTQVNQIDVPLQRHAEISGKLEAAPGLEWRIGQHGDVDVAVIAKLTRCRRAEQVERAQARHRSPQRGEIRFQSTGKHLELLTLALAQALASGEPV